MTDIRPIIRPTVNINGTSRDELVDQRRAVADALRDVVETMGHMVPNGRDYPGDYDRLQRDREIHFARMNQINKLYLDIIEEASAIFSANN